MKKALSILLALLLLGALTGCRGGNAAPTTAATAPATQPTAAATEGTAQPSAVATDPTMTAPAETEPTVEDGNGPLPTDGTQNTQAAGSTGTAAKP